MKQLSLCRSEFRVRPSDDRAQELRTGGGWFYPLCGQYSFQVFATTFIPIHCFPLC